MYLMKKPEFKVIVGLGKTGLSVARYLLQQGCQIAVNDSRPNPPGLTELKEISPAIKLSLGKFDEELLSRADELIVSPGISLKEPAIAKQIARGIPAIGDVELFARVAKAPIIGITGTNGKSTVTTLVGEMAHTAGLKVKVGGNLGTPVLDLLDDQADLYVLELSSFQLETTHSLKTISAVVLNISPDHMDRYQNLEEYVFAKQVIYQGCQTPVINREDPVSFSGLKNPAIAVSFGLNEPQAGQFGLRQKNLVFGTENLMAIDEVKIKGMHQIANALAALALGYAAKLPMPAMLASLKTFQGLAHRCQWVAAIDDVDWYNDSKGTNVNSTLAAIEGLGSVIGGKLILLAGGQGKQQDFTPLAASVKKYVSEVILIGEDAKIIAAALQNTVPICFAQDLAEAVKIAKKAAKKQDAVVLSPACASFDMFNNFEHRGEVFMSLVRELKVKS